MLKRRDWSLFQGQDGSGSDRESSDEDINSEPEEDDGSQAAPISGSDEEDGGSAASEDADEDVGGRLEDISEDDFEAKDLDEEAKTLKEQWLSGKQLSEQELKAALACRLCKGVLLISPAALKNHIQSKRHLNKQKKRSSDFEAICLAKQLKNDNLETHHERLERLRKASSEKSEAAKKPADGQVKTKRAVRRALMKARKQAAKQAEGSQDQPKKGKPGKRQREAMKEGSLSIKGAKRQKLSKADSLQTEQQEQNGGQTTSANISSLTGKASPSFKSSSKETTRKTANSKNDKHSLGQDSTAGETPKKLKKKKGAKEKATVASKANRAERRAVKQARIKG